MSVILTALGDTIRGFKPNFVLAKQEPDQIIGDLIRTGKEELNFHSGVCSSSPIYCSALTYNKGRSLIGFL